MVRSMVEDAREVEGLATAAYRELHGFQWGAAYDEFVTLYVAAMRMPSLVFERLAERLDKVNEDISKRARSAHRLSPEAEQEKRFAFHHAQARASAMP